MPRANVFDILGPVMVGPSSSHTAGGVRLGLMTRKILGDEPREAKITLHGSFAETGKGHGANLALAGAEMALAQVKSVIPVDEVIDTIAAISNQMPCALRETVQGGLAASPTGRKIQLTLS